MSGKDILKEIWLANTGLPGFLALKGLSGIEKHIREEGKKEGYNTASREYEEKMRKQAEEFFSQKRTFQTDKEDYEKLIEQYKGYINGLKDKLNKSEEELEQLRELEKEYSKLLGLQG